MTVERKMSHSQRTLEQTELSVLVVQLLPQLVFELELAALLSAHTVVELELLEPFETEDFEPLSEWFEVVWQVALLPRRWVELQRVHHRNRWEVQQQREALLEHHNQKRVESREYPI